MPDSPEKECLKSVCRIDYLAISALITQFPTYSDGSSCSHNGNDKANGRTNTCEVTDAPPYVQIIKGPKPSRKKRSLMPDDYSSFL